MRYTKNTLSKLLNAKKQITDTTTQCHFRKQYKCLEGKGLNPNQITVLSYIYDTLELSWTNGDDFYDKKRHNYYAVVTRKTISDLYNLGESTVGEVLQQLEDIGYIRKVHSLKGGLRVFPLHFIRTKHDTLNSSESKRSNVTPNNTHVNNTQSTSDTEHTSSSQLNADDKIKKIVLDTIKKLKGNDENQAVQDNKEINDGKDDKHLNYAVLGTKAMPEKANKSINIIAKSLYPDNTKKRSKFIHDVNGMVFKFKSAIFKKNDLYKQSRWENNETLTNQFNHSIYEMLYNSFSGQRDVDSSYAYFGGSLRKFFTKIVDQLLGKHTGSTQSHSKSDKSSVNGNHRIKEKVPYWAKDGYTPDCHKLSKDKKSEIEARLKRLNAKLG